MKSFAPYLTIAVIAAILGGLTVHSCSKETPARQEVTVRIDTFEITVFDTIRTYENIPRPLLPQPVAPATIDTSAQEYNAEAMADFWQEQAEYWTEQATYLAGIEAEAVKHLPEAEVSVGFSMPKFLRQPSTAFYAKVHRQYQDTNKTYTEYYTRPLSFWERFGHGPTISAGFSPLSQSFDLFIGYGIHYRINH